MKTPTPTQVAIAAVEELTKNQDPRKLTWNTLQLRIVSVFAAAIEQDRRLAFESNFPPGTVDEHSGAVIE